MQLNVSLGKDILSSPSDINKIRAAYIHSFTLLTGVVEHLQHLQSGSPVITWNPAEWMSVALECISNKVRVPLFLW